MEFITFDEFKSLDIYNDFMKKNPDKGFLMSIMFYFLMV